jgi:hypothetical protein
MESLAKLPSKRFHLFRCIMWLAQFQTMALIFDTRYIKFIYEEGDLVPPSSYVLF